MICVGHLLVKLEIKKLFFLTLRNFNELPSNVWSYNVCPRCLYPIYIVNYFNNRSRLLGHTVGTCHNNFLEDLATLCTRNNRDKSVVNNPAKKNNYLATKYWNKLVVKIYIQLSIFIREIFNNREGLQKAFDVTLKRIYWAKVTTFSARLLPLSVICTVSDFFMFTILSLTFYIKSKEKKIVIWTI